MKSQTEIELKFLVPSSARIQPQPIREIEFELVSGSIAPMLALVERWRKRFGLIHDPRSKAERGDQWSGGSAFPPPRKGTRPTFHDDATASEAFGAVLDECRARFWSIINRRPGEGFGSSRPMPKGLGLNP